MLARDLTISTFFLGDQGSALTVSEGSLTLHYYANSFVLHDGCGDGGGCEESVVEHCEDSVVVVDGYCDIEASISSLFLLRYTALATLCFLIVLHFNGVHYFSVKIVPISKDALILPTVMFSSFSCR